MNLLSRVKLGEISCPSANKIQLYIYRQESFTLLGAPYNLQSRKMAHNTETCRNSIESDKLEECRAIR